MRLLSFEQHFAQKVDEVDAKYRAQLDDVMAQNAQLRFEFKTLKIISQEQGNISPPSK